jgi:hypothetical protein
MLSDFYPGTYLYEICAHLLHLRKNDLSFAPLRLCVSPTPE